MQLLQGLQDAGFVKAAKHVLLSGLVVREVALSLRSRGLAINKLHGVVFWMTC